MENEELLTKIQIHLEFLEFRVEVEEGSLIARRAGGKPTLVIDTYPEGANCRVLIHCNKRAGEDRLGLLLYINDMNKKAVLLRYSVSERGILFLEGWCQGKYIKEKFGRFLTRFDSEFQQFLEAPGTKTYVKKAKEEIESDTGS